MPFRYNIGIEIGSQEGGDAGNGGDQQGTQGPSVYLPVWEEGAKGVDAESVQRGERNGLYGSGQHRVHDHGGRGIYGYEE